MKRKQPTSRVVSHCSHSSDRCPQLSFQSTTNSGNAATEHGLKWLSCRACRVLSLWLRHGCPSTASWAAKSPHSSQLFRPNTTHNHREQEQALYPFTREIQNIAITSMASWSFSMSSPFFFSDSADAFLVVTTVTTLVTVGPVFYKKCLKTWLHYCTKQRPSCKKHTEYLYFWILYAEQFISYFP